MAPAPSTLAYWVKAYKEGKLGEIGKTQKTLTEVEMERDILKLFYPKKLGGNTPFLCLISLSVLGFRRKLR